VVRLGGKDGQRTPTVGKVEALEEKVKELTQERDNLASQLHSTFSPKSMFGVSSSPFMKLKRPRGIIMSGGVCPPKEEEDEPLPI